MPNLSIAFEVYCATCGASLSNQSSGSSESQGLRVDVFACENCVELAREEGHAAGYYASDWNESDDIK